MPARNREALALTDSTDDPGAASTNAVSRPKPGDAPLLWYRDTKPRFYRPYLIRVVKRDDTMMEFVFLDARTGKDLALSRPMFQISYHDGRYAHSALPSTAHKVKTGSAQSCGLLFISDLYMQGIPRADRDAVLLAGGGNGKWPWTEGKLAELKSVA